jgi:hypothetical protein
MVPGDGFKFIIINLMFTQFAHNFVIRRMISDQIALHSIFYLKPTTYSPHQSSSADYSLNKFPILKRKNSQLIKYAIL